MLPRAAPFQSRRSGVIYAYEFTRQAMAQFQHLDPWLAEETLDELETLTKSPLSARMKSPAGAVHDFTRNRDRQTLYVFLTVTAYPDRQLLRVTSIGTHVKSQ
jgi:hypothetical protein